MGGLEGTNRLGGRVEQPITPLHTSNPKPTMQFRRAHVTSVTLHLKFKTERSRYMRSYKESQLNLLLRYTPKTKNAVQWVDP